MLDHGVTLETKSCRLRPMLESDEANVLNLWNQDFVVGKLFMSKTAPETYRKYFEKYKTDANEWRWIVEDEDKNFIGTISFRRGENSCIIGGFALFPTSRFLSVVPVILVNDFVFNVLEINRIDFTINTTNRDIRKFHKVLLARNTGEITTKPSSDGGMVTLEHWYYEKSTWIENQNYYNGLCS